MSDRIADAGVEFLLDAKVEMLSAPSVSHGCDQQERSP
jgi:hypothetical protein